MHWRKSGSVILCALVLAFAVWPSPPAQQSSAPVRFAFGGNAAEIPAEFLENLVFLPVRINETQPSLFLLDSMAAASSIDPARAAELGLAGLRNPVLKLPGVEFPLAALPATARANFAEQTGRPFQGALGNDFLGSVVVEVDYGRQTVRLYDPGAYKYSGKGVSVPLSFGGGVPLIRTKLSLPGQKAREGEFTIDTTLDAAVMVSEQFAEAHHLFSAHMKTIQASDPQINSGETIALGRAKEIQIGPFQVDSAIVAFSPKGSAAGMDKNVAGTIGGGILRRFVVTFDYAHKQMFLAANPRFADYEEEDKSGLSIVAKGPGLKTFEVLAVQPSTPAGEAGIQKGDIISGIDEEAAADLTLASIRYLFRQIGHRYKLSIERNGQSLQITIQMRRLV
jgi:PDZ domain-containing protein